MADQQANRPHRKGKEKKAPTGGPNPKAFAFNAPGRLAKQGARSQDVRRDIHTTRLHTADTTRSAKGASTSPSSTVSPKRLPPSLSESSVQPAWARQPSSRA